MADQPLRSRGSQLQDRIRRFTRVEKAFYGSIVLTGIILAVSIIFMQTRILSAKRFDKPQYGTKNKRE